MEHGLWAYVNYLASVAFAITAAVLIGTEVAAWACMMAWLSCYLGSYAALTGSDKAALYANSFTAVAAVVMCVAWLFKVFGG